MKTFRDLLGLKEHVFLSSIADDGDQKLKARLCLGGHSPLTRPIVGEKVEELLAKPVEYSNANYVDLSWNRYLQFTVCDEGISAILRDQHYEGGAVRLFSRSLLLSRIGEISNGTHTLRGTVQHFGLYCMNHIVDVLAYGEPEIVDLGSRSFAFGEPLKSKSDRRRPS